MTKDEKTTIKIDRDRYADAAKSDLKSQQSSRRKSELTTVRIYDKPMCCSTGVCGPEVDPVLPRFAADLQWLSDQGLDVVRFNLAQQPGEFANDSVVQRLLSTEGVDCLPLVFINGEIVSRGEYPSRESLASWTGTAWKQSILPMLSDSDACCGDADCC